MLIKIFRQPYLKRYEIGKELGRNKIKRRKNLDNNKKGSNFAPQKGSGYHVSKFRKHDSVAQLVEQMTLNHWVVGSSPTGVTIKDGRMPQNAEIT